MLLLLCAAHSQAVMPAGHYEYDFSGTAMLWDVSGGYDDEFGLLEIDMSIDLTMDPSGSFIATGYASASMDGIDVDMDYRITGSVKGKGAVTTVTMQMVANGTADDGWDTVGFSASQKFKGTIDPVRCTIYGFLKIKISVEGEGSTSASAEFEMGLPDGMTGEFLLLSDLESWDGVNVVGEGQIVLSNGTSYGFAITGKYSAKKDQTKVSFSGAAGKMKTQLVDESLASLKGKVAGQKLGL
jgi:hypothetical protein